MKDQYFGDFGDYQKFSLLKHLRDFGEFSIIVHWMKTQDDSSNDGSKVKYLTNPSEWSSFDPEIFDFLHTNIPRRKRDLSIYEKSSHSKNLLFINNHIEDLAIRTESMQKIENDKQSNLIFFDPDNGIEVKSMTIKNIHKYTTWSEIKTAFKSGKSVLIYQHFSRVNRDKFIAQKIEEFNNHFNLKNRIFVIRVKHSVYFLVTQTKHEKKVSKTLKNYEKAWNQLVSISD